MWQWLGKLVTIAAYAWFLLGIVWAPAAAGNWKIRLLFGILVVIFVVRWLKNKK